MHCAGLLKKLTKSSPVPWINSVVVLMSLWNSQKQWINVIIVKDEGILHLPEEILFERSSWDIKANTRGVDPLRTLAKALDQVLPCYTGGPRSRQNDCPKSKAKVEAIFIEGHAD